MLELAFVFIAGIALGIWGDILTDLHAVEITTLVYVTVILFWLKREG